METFVKKCKQYVNIGSWNGCLSQAYFKLFHRDIDIFVENLWLKKINLCSPSNT